jgi:hypothetical protein
VTAGFAVGPALGEGFVDALLDAVGVGLALRLVLGLTEAEGLTFADGDAPGDVEADAFADGDASGEPDGDTDADADPDGDTDGDALGLTDADA